jgi:uncharacterized protein (DUF983 family)
MANIKYDREEILPIEDGVIYKCLNCGAYTTVRAGVSITPKCFNCHTRHMEKHIIEKDETDD